MRRPWTRIHIVGIALAIGAALAAPAVASAAEVTPSVVTTGPYELDFTLPSESRSGCLVCHADPALVRVREGSIVSFYIDEASVAASTHRKEQCVACHLDFTYRSPHRNDGWQVTAKSSCGNCHDEQSRQMGAGVHHSVVPAPVPAGAVASTEDTASPRPLCGDCHGSHEMKALTERGGTDWKQGQAEIHSQGWEVCGRCHQDYWDNYNDYYHGAAYKRGATDAPACWDCHGWHDILPSKDRSSKVNERHLVETCGQEGCHAGVDETYTQYAAFIHGRAKVEAANPLRAFLRSIVNAFSTLFGGSDGA